MDIDAEIFISYDLPDNKNYSNTIESIVQLGDTLWVGYEANGSLSGALALFSIKEKRFLKVSSEAGQLDNVHDIFPDPHDHDKVWIASSDLYLTDRSLSKVQAYTLPHDQSPTRRGITEILSLNQEHLLIGSTIGLYKYNVETSK